MNIGLKLFKKKKLCKKIRTWQTFAELLAAA